MPRSARSARGVFCLIRVLGATLVALRVVPRLPGDWSLIMRRLVGIDAACGPRFAMSALQHMP